MFQLRAQNQRRVAQDDDHRCCDLWVGRAARDLHVGALGELLGGLVDGALKPVQPGGVLAEQHAAHVGTERHRIGVEQIMFESDNPHSDCNWPHTRKLLEESLADVPDDEARLIVEDNARRVFNFPRLH